METIIFSPSPKGFCGIGGAGRGHGLGYPTANLETSPRLLLPAFWLAALGLLGLGIKPVAITLAPSLAEAHANLGHVLNAQKDPAAAMDA